MQTLEPAVQPRRNILSALWVWAIGLLAAPKLLAADKACPSSQVIVPDYCKEVMKKYELTILVGRLCLDKCFRDELFKSETLDDPAIKILQADGMLTRPDVAAHVDKILRARNSPNKVQIACQTVQNEIVTAVKPSMPCPDWPC